MTDTFWTLDRIADALAERAIVTHPRGSTAIRGISTDTRSLQKGDCFVALIGERFDAHEMLDQAVAAGAAALVVSRPPKLRVGVGMNGANNGAVLPSSQQVPVFIVDDTLVALGDLARYWRSAWGKTVIGVAGSNGKTSTKELIRAALGSVYEVHATTGNLNNRVGVPLTVLAIPSSADLAVVEMGTSLPGEVAMLRAIVKPDVAVVTCIAEEHLEGLGDLAGVLREESAVFEGVPLAIIPAADTQLADAAKARAARVAKAGLNDGDIRAETWSLAPDGTGMLTYDGISISIPLRGLHNLQNAMLALAVARACGVATTDAARGVAAMPAPPMRAAWTALGRATVINDAYNANPGSTRAALAMLAGASAPQRVAVLGTMRELGVNAPKYHDDVARAALATSADVVAGIGDFAEALRRVAPEDQRVVTAPDVEELWPLLRQRLHPEATILLKASRGVRLERLLPHITTWATA